MIFLSYTTYPVPSFFTQTILLTLFCTVFCWKKYLCYKFPSCWTICITTEEGCISKVRIESLVFLFNLTTWHCVKLILRNT